MDDIRILPVIQSSDNYCYLIISGNDAAVVDISSAEPVFKTAQQNHICIRYILSTHHHSDHTSGNRALKELTGAMVIGGDTRIDSIDAVLVEGERITLGYAVIEILEVPGHTKHQVAFYMPQQGCVFTGDTLFGCGCGRIFEGSPEQMYASLAKLSELPEDTNVYFGHEYTSDNIAFALTVEPDNVDLQQRSEMVKCLIQSGRPTTPSTIALEKKTNPFLRTNSKTIRKYLHMIDRSPIAVFAELRKRKNEF